MSARGEVAEQMASAASGWLDSLDAGQRRVAHGTTPADDASDTERRRWFYTPTDHGGLTLHEQRPAQQQLAMRLVASGLSEAGFNTVANVIGLENVLDRVEGFGSGFGRERARDPGLYYLRVFGEPARAGVWGWRFGGHHVSLNNLVVDGEVAAATPCFLGANPATTPLLGDVVQRPLGQVEDLARSLVASLPADLARLALLPGAVPDDILTGNRTAVGDVVTRAGVAGGDLDDGQRELLEALVATYVGRVPPGLAPAYDVSDLHLAWAGDLVPGRPHYYRVQGPRMLLEWDNTQDAANHGHSVWRDPESDFGLDVLARHRAAHH